MKVGMAKMEKTECLFEEKEVYDDVEKKEKRIRIEELCEEILKKLDEIK